MFTLCSRRFEVAVQGWPHHCTNSTRPGMLRSCGHARLCPAMLILAGVAIMLRTHVDQPQVGADM